MPNTNCEVEILKDRVDLRRLVESLPHGKNPKHCPFCREDGLAISDEKQVYHCFTCKRSGNVVTFLKEYLGIPFAKAVEVLKALTDKPNISEAEPKTI